MNISGKKIIIFGGTSGIGEAATKIMSEKGAAEIIAISRNPDKITNVPENVTLEKIDVLDEEALKSFFKNQGEFDVLINCATGGTRAVGPFLEMDLDFFQDLWEVCAKGAFLISQQAIPRLLDGGGSLLFTGATASIRSKPPFTAFAAAKSAERSLAQGLAKEFGPQGIHVAHVIIDGIIDGDKVNLRFPDFANSKGEDGKLNIDSIAENFLMLHKQKKSTWSFEIDLRPWSENW